MGNSNKKIVKMPVQVHVPDKDIFNNKIKNLFIRNVPIKFIAKALNSNETKIRRYLNTMKKERKEEYDKINLLKSIMKNSIKNFTEIISNNPDFFKEYISSIEDLLEKLTPNITLYELFNLFYLIPADNIYKYYNEIKEINSKDRMDFFYIMLSNTNLSKKNIQYIFQKSGFFYKVNNNQDTEKIFFNEKAKIEKFTKEEIKSILEIMQLMGVLYGIVYAIILHGRTKDYNDVIDEYKKEMEV